LWNSTICFFIYLLYTYCSEDNANSKVKFVYTAMHGVGTPFAERAFEAFKLQPFIPVKEQVTPDPDFPTVAFPNPEEGKGSLVRYLPLPKKNSS
jgi:phosphoglucomutase